MRVHAPAGLVWGRFGGVPRAAAVEPADTQRGRGSPPTRRRLTAALLQWSRGKLDALPSETGSWRPSRRRCLTLPVYDPSVRHV